jgi:hypothetical protein
MTDFSKEDLADIETFAGGLALKLFRFKDVALCSVGQDKVGVAPGHTQRLAMLDAIRARALALGYAGPAFPARDPDDAICRRRLLATAMRDVPTDALWSDKFLWAEGQIADLDLDDPDLTGALQRIQATYQPPEPKAATPAAPGFSPDNSAQQAAAACLGGSHQYGGPDPFGWRTCARCGVVSTIPADNPGAFDVSRPDLNPEGY